MNLPRCEFLVTKMIAFGLEDLQDFVVTTSFLVLLMKHFFKDRFDCCSTRFKGVMKDETTVFVFFTISKGLDHNIGVAEKIDGPSRGGVG